MVTGKGFHADFFILYVALIHAVVLIVVSMIALRALEHPELIADSVIARDVKFRERESRMAFERYNYGANKAFKIESLHKKFMNRLKIRDLQYRTLANLIRTLNSIKNDEVAKGAFRFAKSYGSLEDDIRTLNQNLLTIVKEIEVILYHLKQLEIELNRLELIQDNYDRSKDYNRAEVEVFINNYKNMSNDETRPIYYKTYQEFKFEEIFPKEQIDKQQIITKKIIFKIKQLNIQKTYKKNNKNKINYIFKPKYKDYRLKIKTYKNKRIKLKEQIDYTIEKYNGSHRSNGDNPLIKRLHKSLTNAAKDEITIELKDKLQMRDITRDIANKSDKATYSRHRQNAKNKIKNILFGYNKRKLPNPFPETNTQNKT